ncbi:unnamed protein product [Pseudo-nitzschia multistriata]|uniref:Uncharacterized protein n=1 Tax=Pseudo-nitzschia multistriata TaxID=183589 RepID=A0A448YXR1_9STRA|nr:unnamed protein product [Pseudo-nitzschia multistriata]
MSLVWRWKVHLRLRPRALRVSQLPEEDVACQGCQEVGLLREVLPWGSVGHQCTVSVPLAWFHRHREEYHRWAWVEGEEDDDEEKCCPPKLCFLLV